jgi:hypothetical protein
MVQVSGFGGLGWSCKCVLSAGLLVVIMPAKRAAEHPISIIRQVHELPVNLPKHNRITNFAQYSSRPGIPPPC